jgi:hypothetical protein
MKRNVFDITLNVKKGDKHIALSVYVQGEGIKTVSDVCDLLENDGFIVVDRINYDRQKDGCVVLDTEEQMLAKSLIASIRPSSYVWRTA